MTILFRYLAKEIFNATLLLLIALLALFALFDLIRELSDVGKGGYSLSVVLLYVTLSQPSHIAVILPIAALMGTLFAIARISAQSELTVMRSSGLSLVRLAGFATVIGLLFSLVTLLFGEFIAPAAEEMAKRMRVSATSSVVATQFRSGFWVKDDHAFINIQSVTVDTQLLDLRIYEFDSAYRLSSLRIAKRATYDLKTAGWSLENVEKTTFKEKMARMERLPLDQWKTAMTPDLLAVLRVQPDEMSLLSLSAYIDHLRDNKQNSTHYELAFWGKALLPATVIIMMLLALPFAIQSNRAGGLGGKLLLGIMLGLGFYFINQLASNLTVLNNWPALVSAAIPLLVFLAIAVALLAQKEYAASLQGRARPG
ncbi:MAG: LPS export ABC transporter permease LptG [Betaproteobacteria bacterium]